MNGADVSDGEGVNANELSVFTSDRDGGCLFPSTGESFGLGFEIVFATGAGLNFIGDLAPVEVMEGAFLLEVANKGGRSSFCLSLLPISLLPRIGWLLVPSPDNAFSGSGNDGGLALLAFSGGSGGVGFSSSASTSAVLSFRQAVHGP